MMMMKTWLQVSVRGLAISTARLWGIDDHEEVATSVANKCRTVASVDDFEVVAAGVQQENHYRRWPEGFQRRRWSDGGSGKK